MSLAVIGFTSLLGVPEAREARAQFAEYKATFNKVYAAEEEAARFSAFQMNLALIEQRNAAEGADGATHGWTKFTDLTPAEFSERYLRSTSGSKKFVEAVPLPELAQGETASKDWTGVYTTPVKDQGQCGSCWAFSATEQIESDVQRELGEKYELSPQQITSCDTYDNGCGGGNTETAYKYVKESAGLVTESNYPYTSGHGGHAKCVASDLADPVISVKGFKTIGESVNGKAGVESSMAKYVGATGPLSICVDASSWQTYKGGVLKNCGNRIDHCVQAVGIDTGKGVWKVRNSWNTDWGEDGFIRLQYGQDACGLTNDATWVTVVDAVPSPAPIPAPEGESPAKQLVEDVFAPRPREVKDLREAIEQLV